MQSGRKGGAERGPLCTYVRKHLGSSVGWVCAFAWGAAWRPPRAALNHTLNHRRPCCVRCLTRSSGPNCRRGGGAGRLCPRAITRSKRITCPRASSAGPGASCDSITLIRCQACASISQRSQSTHPQAATRKTSLASASSPPRGRGPQWRQWKLRHLRHTSLLSPAHPACQPKVPASMLCHRARRGVPWATGRASRPWALRRRQQANSLLRLPTGQAVLPQPRPLAGSHRPGHRQNRGQWSPLWRECWAPSPLSM